MKDWRNLHSSVTFSGHEKLCTENGLFEQIDEIISKWKNKYINEFKVLIKEDEFY